MSKEESFKKIKSFLLERYKDNLAAVLVFGSAATNFFKEGKSDIDTIILIKDEKGLNLEEEKKFLISALKRENFTTQYLHSLDSIKKYAKERASWSTYLALTLKEASIILYSTPEFEKFKRELQKNPPSKEKLKEYVAKKDEFELQGYFNERKDFDFTKAIFAHLRRKLQIIVFLQKNKIIFDYRECLMQVNLQEKERQKLIKLAESYEKRLPLSKEQEREFNALAKDLTKQIMKL